MKQYLNKGTKENEFFLDYIVGEADEGKMGQNKMGNSNYFCN